MLKKIKNNIILLMILFVFNIFSSYSFANKIEINGLVISDLWIREPIGNSSTTSGYMTIKNTNINDDTLISISSDFSEQAQIHSMKIENNIMKMERLINGLLIRSGQTIYLKPGSNHIMFLNLKKSFNMTFNYNIYLNFRERGIINLNTKVFKNINNSRHKHR